jgi:hypothetical protein
MAAAASWNGNKLVRLSGDAWMADDPNAPDVVRNAAKDED